MTDFDTPIDLHIHSSFSEDADYPVDAIFAMAHESGVSVISITDHDSVESIPVALSLTGAHPVRYVPGVELTTMFPRDGSQQHVLGYFVDPDNRRLQETLAGIRTLRTVIAQRRIDALRGLGFALDNERVWQRTGGRAPAATSIIIEVFENDANRSDQRLAEYFGGPKESDRIINFYREYFGHGAAAYVPFDSIGIDEGIDCIHAAGGVAVLAHPVFVRNRDWLDEIASMGLDGIEAISTYHTAEDISYYLGFAERRALAVTAGSDFHGPTSKPLITIGGVTGNHYRYFEELAARVRR